MQANTIGNEAHWVEPFGGRRQELVFIGQGLDQDSVTNRNRPGVLPFLVDFTSSSIHVQCHQIIATSKKRMLGREVRIWLDRADSLPGQDYLGDVNLHRELLRR